MHNSLPKISSFIISVIIFHFISINFEVEATIRPDSKSKPKIKKKIKSGPQESSVFDRDLIQEAPLARDIITENAGYYKETSLRRFNGTILGYVTPWNSHGYDIAKTFTKKFDIISPVWLQVGKAGNYYNVAGTHDIDLNWLKDLRKLGKTNMDTVKIFPRVIIEKFTDKDFSKLFASKEERKRMNSVITSACMEYKFDGIVLEMWSQLAAHVDHRILHNIVIELSKDLKSNGIELILVIPPFRDEMPKMFIDKDMDALHEHVYAFSLMTYDFSNIQRPGANAPLYWIEKSIADIVPLNSWHFEKKRMQILMGLNMYGYDYTVDGGGAIVGGAYLDLLKKVKQRLAFDERDFENFFETKSSDGRHYVFYPTLHSINERIKLAQQMGVGISIWELGQGLDYFYDLF